MEESKALHRLTEAADLVGMIEDMLSPTTAEKLSQSSWSGIRITLRNIKDSIQSSQATLSAEMLGRSRAGMAQQNTASSPLPQHNVQAPNNGAMQQHAPVAPETARMQITRKDLKAQLERVIDNR